MATIGFCEGPLWWGLRFFRLLKFGGSDCEPGETGKKTSRSTSMPERKRSRKRAVHVWSNGETRATMPDERDPSGAIGS